MEETKAKIRTFLERHLRNNHFRDDEDFFAEGFVNSLFAMQLVMFVEKEFNVAVEDQDLDISNFNSVNAISGFLDGKISKTDSAAAPQGPPGS
jgi:methoxymalonate biosynthesis acyl carrier protein